MNTVPVFGLRRREFLSTASLWIAGCAFLDLFPDRRPSLQTTTALPEELTAADLEAIKKSVMAGELDHYFGKGYSCAESLLIVGLRHLQLSEDLVWVAAGFGGGMLHREACGFLTSGIMDVGLAAVEVEKLITSFPAPAEKP